MRRGAVIVTLVLLGAACAPAAEPTTTSAPTTSTTIATTTTSILEVTGESVDPGLATLIQALYDLPQGADAIAAPAPVIEGFANSATRTGPTQATAYQGLVGEATKVAVVEAGDDVTLAVADPDWRVVGGWWPSHQVDPELGEFPRTVAVIGSDARPHEDRNRTRTDSIHFVTFDGEGSAVLVGVPRDSWVPIPGHGNSKLNAALSVGGPELMMETFSELTGAEFDGYMLTGFAGFQSMIEVLGGLEIDVPMALSDRAAKASIEAGPQVLSAADALAFSRVRKSLSGGDLDRQANGGLALIAAAAMVRGMGVAAIPDLMTRSWDMYSTDMSAEQLLTLAAAVTLVDPGKTANVVAPGSPGSAGQASVVYLGDGAPALFADMVDGHLDG
jgi:LCP family protein required for cell wall assembly